jgi:hypothetical protein
VINQAKIVMADYLIDHAFMYIAAMVRRAGVLMLLHHRDAAHGAAPAVRGLPRPHSREWDRVVEAELRAAPPLARMLLPDGGGVPGSRFTTGCGGNGHEWAALSWTEKRRILFGLD